MNHIRNASVTAALLLAAGLPAQAAAQTASSTLGVTATVSASCTVTTSPVAFGSVNTLGSAVDATGGLTVTCTNGTDWSAAAGAGTGPGASVVGRKMSAGSDILNYSLYVDSNRTSVWGDGSASSAPITDEGTGSAQSVTIYGRVQAGQSAARAGSYSDTVAVTVSY